MISPHPSTSLLSPYSDLPWNRGSFFARWVLLASVVVGMAGCAGPTQRGPLTLASSGWLIRPGMPQRYLDKELQAVLPLQKGSGAERLFVFYQEKGQSQWFPNWAGKLDFTGVAWDDAKAGVLIHPQYVVFASHFPRRVGETLTFHDRSGRPIQRKLTARRRIHQIRNPDVTVGKLDQPVPDTVTSYPLLPTGIDYRVLNGAPLLVTDKERKVHVFRINRVSQHGYEKIGARPALGEELGSGWSERLERGDSGHPAFVVVGGRLVLVSTLKGGGWGTLGPFFGGERLQRAVLRAIATLEAQ